MIGDAVYAFSRRLDDNVDLMWRAPDTQHNKFGGKRIKIEETSVEPFHRVFAVRRRFEQLDSPIWVDRVENLDEPFCR